MMSDTIDVLTTCLCGRSNFTTTIPHSSLPMPGHFCHCTSCRRIHGALSAFHAPWSAPPSSAIEKLAKYKSSERVTQYFCPTCGAHMLDSSPLEGSLEHNWTIATPLVQGAENIFEYKEHIYIEDTKDGGTSDFVRSYNGTPLLRWAGRDGESEQLPPYWDTTKDLRARPEAHDPSGKVKCLCHCGGIEFYLHRPNIKVSPEADFGLPDKWFDVATNRYIVEACGCDSCRLDSGADIMPWIFVPPSRFSLPDGSPLPEDRMFGTMKHYRSSENVSRNFCGWCGATVFYMNDERTEWDLAVGLIDAESGARAEEWLEWNTVVVSYAKLAYNKKMLEAWQHGYKAWEERKHHKGIVSDYE
ncbi:hypothetical protein M501DRAFT_997291 [Patellaria atrata CBS 101060]|uniref:CENP-V/GFA domain-containing protein n=1 Tax=Patellaria atrata CBS 101060 TaxID=1346257 RepID=A0A9P4S4G6_9PEZI|nr:hypothetical protein M501DRAFT_997291 [Patellaria atrata CBS 101060]